MSRAARLAADYGDMRSAKTTLVGNLKQCDLDILACVWVMDFAAAHP